MNTFLELAQLAGVGLTAGIFSAYIATRRQRSLKWWELRATAYQAVIDSLSDLEYYFDVKYRAEIENRNLSKEYETELKQYWSDGFHKVRKAASSGSFLFSEDVENALGEFMRLRNDSFDSYFEHVDAWSAGTKKCLGSIVGASKKDLKISDSWIF